PTTAFKVVALDVQNAASAPQLAQSSPPVDVIVNQVDITPTLTSVSPLGLAGNASVFAIPYATFLAATNVTTFGGHPASFKITSLDVGSNLQIQIGASAPVPFTLGTGAGSSTFGPGSTLFWTAPSVLNPTLVNAFHVLAYDSVNAAHVNPVYPPE